jgi:subtilase family serine protease
MRLGASAFALLVVSMVMATSASAQTKPNLQYMGLENPNKNMNVSVFLTLPNQAALDALVAQIHDPSSAQYRKFVTPAQFAAQFAPPAASSKAVQNYLTSQGLTITYVDKFNLVVRATGSVANLEKVFGTQVGVYQSQGKTFNLPLATPTIPPQLSTLVNKVTGFSTVKAATHLVRQTNPKTGKPLPGIAVKGHKNGLFFPSDCFEASSPLYLYGTGLEAIYSGNGYTTCGYDPANVQHAYGFDTVINSGLNGAGQTIVIVDAYGSYTIPEDVATFDSINGLPPINLNVIYNPTGGTPDCVVSNGVQCGWEDEVTLDVEWAHAMAPGATIDLVVSPTANFSDLANIDLWVAENIAPPSASHSFGFPEWLLVDYYGDTADYDWQAYVNYIADQVFGVSNNYSSGDSGDYVTLGDDLYPDVSFPAGMQNVTSVGGTSLAIASNGSYKWENGWGTNATWLNYAPPYNFGFQYGGGGGTSLVTPAPAWQTAYLSNTWRQQPDVAMDADPFTGVEIVWTSDGVVGDPQYVYVFGGTSLSCPMFSAVWSEVAQAVASDYDLPTVNLGNAAPILYEESNLFPGSFNDVKPVSSGANAHGTIFYNGVPTAYSQWDLAQPYQSAEYFWESIWNAGGGYFYTVTFGTDSSLTTGPGWDNVTGVGTPAGASFIAPFLPED